MQFTKKVSGPVPTVQLVEPPLLKRRTNGVKMVIAAHLLTFAATKIKQGKYLLMIIVMSQKKLHRAYKTLKSFFIFSFILKFYHVHVP